MASPAPQAPNCGCRIALPMIGGRVDIYALRDPNEPAITYCATHAAAFRLADLVVTFVARGHAHRTENLDDHPLSDGALDDAVASAAALLREIGR
jgi:hypothetical protein